MIEYLNPDDEPFADFGLSTGAASGRMVFAGGMALDLATLRRMPEADSIAAETRITLQQIARILGEAGCTLADVVKSTCYLSDDAHRAEFWPAYRAEFGEGPYPARTTVVAGLAGDCRVEIDVVAIRPEVRA